MPFKRQIAFTSSWADTIKIATVLGLFILLIMVFLQPFDTFKSQPDYKALKLAGYALTVFIPIVVSHFIELLACRRNNYKWSIVNEISYLAFIIISISIASYVYHAYIFSDASITLKVFGSFFVFYCLPFCTVFIPFLSFLRFTFGKVIIIDEANKNDKTIQVAGENKDENITIKMSQFIYAEACQNYVDIHYLNDDKNVERKVVRSTFRSVVDQVSDAYQVHRSFLVNLDYLDKVSGNSRKRFIQLKGVDADIPVSKKYHQSIAEHLQIQP